MLTCTYWRREWLLAITAGEGDDLQLLKVGTDLQVKPYLDIPSIYRIPSRKVHTRLPEEVSWREAGPPNHFDDEPSRLSINKSPSAGEARDAVPGHHQAPEGQHQPPHLGLPCLGRVRHAQGGRRAREHPISCPPRQKSRVGTSQSKSGSSLGNSGDRRQSPHTLSAHHPSPAPHMRTQLQPRLP